MTRLLDKSFVYTNSASTDVRKTIRREQARLKKIVEAEAAAEAANLAEAASKLSRRKIGGK